MGWEVVDEVEPIALFIIKPWELLLHMLIMPCYARRRGLGLSVLYDRCEIVYLMVQLKVATLIHIWVDWLRAPGESSVVLGYPGGPV